MTLGISPVAGTMTAYASETDDIEMSVKAHDITKDISDKEGNAYDPNRPGTYIAEYLVARKDKSEMYFVSRNVILTDTEGLAESASNGGETQKTDTEDEEEYGETEAVTETDIKILSSAAESEEALKTLEEDIENGDVLLFFNGKCKLDK